MDLSLRDVGLTGIGVARRPAANNKTGPSSPRSEAAQDIVLAGSPEDHGGSRKGAVMRLVLRILLFECALSWLMLLAGYVGVARQIWPFATARFRGRAWRIGLGLLIGLTIAAGWPLMFAAPTLAVSTHGDWLNLAIPWWLMIGTAGSLVLVVRRVTAAEARAALESECRCGTCIAYGRSLASPRRSAAL
jgi:hypothetical protein